MMELATKVNTFVGKSNPRVCSCRLGADSPRAARIRECNSYAPRGLAPLEDMWHPIRAAWTPSVWMEQRLTRTASCSSSTSSLARCPVALQPDRFTRGGCGDILGPGLRFLHHAWVPMTIQTHPT